MVARTSSLGNEPRDFADRNAVRPELPTLRELGRRFARLRNEQDISQEEAASRISTGTDTIDMFERTGAIDADSLIRLVEAYSNSPSLIDAFEVASSELAPRTVGEILEAWAKGAIDSHAAIALGGFDSYADLLEAAIINDVPLRTELTPRERRQAETFVRLLEEA